MYPETYTGIGGLVRKGSLIGNGNARGPNTKGVRHALSVHLTHNHMEEDDAGIAGADRQNQFDLLASEHDPSLGFHGVGTVPRGKCPSAGAPTDFSTDVQGLWL